MAACARTSRWNGVVTDPAAGALSGHERKSPSLLTAGEPQKHEITYKDVLLLVFGVILPILTLGVEMTLRMCAQAFLDPMPWLWHVLLIMMAPAGNFLVRRTYVKQGSQHPLLVGFANSMAIGVSLLYAIIFVPMLLVLLIAIFFMGMGALVLFLSSLLGRIWLKASAPKGKGEVKPRP